MKKYLSVLAAALLVAGIGCKMDSDVMATYDGGKITRGEFEDWYSSRGLSEKLVFRTAQSQINRLNEMMLEKIGIMEADKTGFTSTEGFKTYLSYVKLSLLAEYYRKNLKDILTYDEPAVDIDLIKVKVDNYKIVKGKRVKLSDAELKKAFSEKLEKVNKILGELAGGADFKEVAKKNSDDYTAKKGGEIGFIIKGMREQEVFDAANALKKGEYTKEPVKVATGYYIVMLKEKKNLTDKNIDSSFDDEKQAARFKTRLQTAAISKYMEDLRNSKDLVNNVKTANFNKAADLLFSVGDFKLTVGDFNKLIDYLERAKPTSVVNKPEQRTTQMKRQFADRLFYERYMSREALKKGMDKDKKYLDRWESFKNTAVYAAYRNDAVMGGVNITEKDIRDEYNTYVERMKNTQKRVTDPKLKTPIKSYADMKSQLSDSLISKTRMKKRTDWEDAMLKKYKFSINEKYLVKDEKKEKKENKRPKKADTKK